MPTGDAVPAATHVPMRPMRPFVPVAGTNLRQINDSRRLRLLSCAKNAIYRLVLTPGALGIAAVAH